MDVVVFQDGIYTLALLLPAILWTRSLGCYMEFGEQRLLPGRQFARFDDLFDRVLNICFWFLYFAFALGLALAFGIATPKA
ncbi:MAG: hypothetical protein ACKPKO_23840, partial [Candidatus Fonsibacter sp.]